jgi:hypothetical protein
VLSSVKEAKRSEVRIGGGDFQEWFKIISKQSIWIRYKERSNLNNSRDWNMPQLPQIRRAYRNEDRGVKENATQIIDR